MWVIDIQWGVANRIYKPLLLLTDLLVLLTYWYIIIIIIGLVVRISGYRYRDPGFDPRRYQIFWVVVGLERGPLSLVRSNWGATW